VRSINRRVFDEKGGPAFEGAGRERADVVGAQTFTVAARQVAEMLAWRKAGAWDRAILAVGGISTVERARDVLREGADAVLVATLALLAPLSPSRSPQTRTCEAASPPPAPSLAGLRPGGSGRRGSRGSRRRN